MDTNEIMEIAKSINNVSLAGIKSGQEIERKRHEAQQRHIKSAVDWLQTAIKDQDWKKADIALARLYDAQAEIR